MSMSWELKIISLIMFLIKSRRNLGIWKLLNVSLPDWKKLQRCFPLFLYFSDVSVLFFFLFIFLVQCYFSIPVLTSSQSNLIARIMYFLLSWYLPIFHPAVSTLLVLLPVYWSVLLDGVTVLKALLFSMIFISALMLVCSCSIDLTFYTLLCFYHISTHSPA